MKKIGIIFTILTSAATCSLSAAVDETVRTSRNEVVTTTQNVVRHRKTPAATQNVAQPKKPSATRRKRQDDALAKVKAKCVERLKAVETAVLEAEFNMMNLEVRFKRELYSKYDRFLTTQMTPRERIDLMNAKVNFLKEAIDERNEWFRLEMDDIVDDIGNARIWFNPAELEDERLMPIIEENDKAIEQLIDRCWWTDYFVHITDTGPLLSFPFRPNTDVLLLSVPLVSDMITDRELISTGCTRIRFTDPTRGASYTIYSFPQPMFLNARSIEEILRNTTIMFECRVHYDEDPRPEQDPLINRDASKVKEPGHITMCL